MSMAFMPSDKSVRTNEADILLHWSSGYSLSNELNSIHSVSSFSSGQCYPLYLCKVSAGFPSPASDYLDQDLDLNHFLVDHPSSTFFVRVAGDSMIDVGILPDDYLIVDRARSVKQNDIVIAVVNGELTVKRFCKVGQQIELHPENSAYPVIQVSADIDFLIWGMVIGVFRKH